MHHLIEHYLVHLLTDWAAALLERVCSPWTVASYPRLAGVLLVTAPALALATAPLVTGGWGGYAAAWALLALTVPLAPDAWRSVARVSVGALTAATPGAQQFTLPGR